jgi:hypothetical protein
VSREIGALTGLARWYEANCDGDWEHEYGVSIETLDNPGWAIKIDLTDTLLSAELFDVHEDRYESDREWLRCWKDGSVFQAACGPLRLEDAIEIFLQWADTIAARRAG